MKFLHEELRRAREKAGLSQQALADRAGIPRNQVVRAERGENITIDTLRRIAAHLQVRELTLLDTTGLRIDIIAEPEKLFLAAVENVMRLTGALQGAIQVAMHAGMAAEAARHAALPLTEGQQRPADVGALLLLRALERITEEIETVGKDAKIAS